MKQNLLFFALIAYCFFYLTSAFSQTPANEPNNSSNSMPQNTPKINVVPFYSFLNPTGVSGFGTNTPSNQSVVNISGVGTYGVAPYYQAGLAVDGTTTVSSSGIFGQGGWRGVFGRNDGSLAGNEAIGVEGKLESGSSYTSSGYGIKGSATGGGPNNYGVYGKASGGTINNYAIYGTATGVVPTNYAVYAVASGGTVDNYGVYSSASGTNSWAGYFNGKMYVSGVSGFGTTTPSNQSVVNISGVGTYGVAPYYQAGLAVDGTTTASSSGIFGQGGWRGVFGRNDGSLAGNEAIGVEGRLESGSSYTNSGYGIKGSATGGGPKNYGVFGNASGATTNNYGIYGTATGTGSYAGYFNGNVNVTGSLSKGSGTFKIDHPLDPANKYLYHSFVESPDMMNIYNGNITTDANGVAVVTMPDYFEALNKDFRYQLTVIGTFAQAIISKKINNNSFEIKTNQPTVEVSWQVTGIRKDAYANAHRVVPEVEKEADNKGKFLHAKELGMIEGLQIDNENKQPKSQNNSKVIQANMN